MPRTAWRFRSVLGFREVLGHVPVLRMAARPLCEQRGIRRQAVSIGEAVHEGIAAADHDGVVQRALIDHGSGHEALDQAAMRVAEVYRFSPALNRDEKVPVWVSFPITFKVR